MSKEKGLRKIRRPAARKPAPDAADNRDFANLPLESRIGAVIKRRRSEANLTLADLSAGAGCRAPC